MFAILASCGQNSSGGFNSPIGTTSTFVRPSPTLSTTFPPTSEVTLRLDSVTSTSILITLANNSSQAILFPDHLTECSVVLLQLIPQGTNSQQWQTVAPCRKEILTWLHALAPGKDLTITLTAPSGQWAAGLYRAVLTYTLSGAKATPRTVFSASFSTGNSNLCQRTNVACQASPSP